VHDLVERAELLIEESRLFLDILRSDEKDKSVEAMAFTMVHNKAMITREMLHLYQRLWSSDRFDAGIDEEKMGEEMADRAVYLGKMLFIETLSAIEHSSKKVCRSRCIFKDSQHLRGIMDASRDAGLMGEDRNRQWHDIITVRNLAVHDNAISDRSKRCVIGHLTISMRPNRMMKGPLHTYIELARIVNQNYYEWVCSLDRGGPVPPGQ